jgi:lincosamide nucleotidyltransferase A/C/D/E
MTLSAAQAVELCDALQAAGVRYWVIGGWGVDALLGRQTRPHKDLDILAVREDAAHLRQMFEAFGLTVTHVWQESRWIEDLGQPWPTAFVAADSVGRALDVHLIGAPSGGTIVQHYDNPWSLQDSFTASGSIAGHAIPCVSVATQISMHVGYAVPEEQQRDLELLRGRVAFADAD